MVPLFFTGQLAWRNVAQVTQFPWHTFNAMSVFYSLTHLRAILTLARISPLQMHLRYHVRRATLSMDKFAQRFAIKVTHRQNPR
jgi:hypothetical protein